MSEPSPSAPKPRRGGAPLAWAAGAAALAFLIGLAVWPLLGPALQDYLPEGLRDSAAVRIAELEERIDALERRPAATGASAAEQVDPLARRIAALERDLATLAARPQPEPRPEQPQAPAVDPRLIERLDQVEAGLARLDEMEALLQKGESIDARLAELDEARARAAEAARSSALLAALSQLREAMRAGRPYAEALEATTALARGEESALSADLAPLQAHAEQGLPSVAELAARFERLAGEAAHHAALGPEAGWLERAGHRLAGLVRVRRTGDLQGERPEARIARAEERMAEGDLAGAVEAAGGVERRTEALDRWLADARARLAADAALDALQARVIARADGA